MTFSIIMAVHDAASTLPAALASVAEQTFGNWECLCVDDGSADASGALLAAAAARDGRFRLFRQANAGAAAARNRALAEAKGDYFLFLDADDLLLAGTLGRLDEVLKATGADALVTYPLFREVAPEAPEAARLPRAELAVKAVLESAARKRLVTDVTAPQGFVCGRVYRRARFGALRFPLWLEMMEDMVFWADALAVPARWAVLSGAYYGYRVCRNSISRVRTVTFYYDILAAPKQFFPREVDSLALSPAEARRAWRPFSGAYAGFLRSLCLQWKSFAPEARRALMGELVDLRRLFPFEPFAFLTRVRLACVFRGLGDGRWVDLVEGPLTRGLNALRRLKRRLCR